MKLLDNNSNYPGLADFSWIENVNLVDSPLKADIVFFTGGEDVSLQW